MTHEPVRLLALGDSYTVGTSVPSSEAWPQQLADRLDGRAAVTMVAADSWTSAELLAAYDANPPSEQFAIVTIQIGVNDQFRGLPVGDFLANAEALLERATAVRTAQPGGVVAVSIPDWGVTRFADGRDRGKIAGEIDGFNAAWTGLSERRNVPFVDVTGISRRHPALLAADGLHPSGEQYRLWVEAIRPVVAGLLARSE